jgi:hypothetical protein
MSKPALVHQIRTELEGQLAVTKAAAAEAKEDATGAETKSDGKYDTRAIEAGYLASAQAKQAEKLAEAVRLFTTFDPPNYDEDEAIGPGALVETEHGGEIIYYLRIYQELLGARTGELVEESALMVLSVG